MNDFLIFLVVSTIGIVSVGLHLLRKLNAGAIRVEGLIPSRSLYLALKRRRFLKK